MSIDLSSGRSGNAGAPSGDTLVTGASFLAGFGALASASCCALPLALSMAGVSSAYLVQMGVLVQHRDAIAMAALLVLALGWVVALRRHRAGCKGSTVCARPRRYRFTFGVLSLSTALVGLALAYSWWEPPLIQLLWQWRTGG